MPFSMHHPVGFDYSILIIDREGEWREVGIEATPEAAVLAARRLLARAEAVAESPYPVRVVHRPTGGVIFEEAL